MTTTATKERPILFSGPMVRAILEGRKTQTRRVIKAACKFDKWYRRRKVEWCEKDQWWLYRGLLNDWPTGQMPAPKSYVEEFVLSHQFGQPGDRLWVRETWGPCEGGFIYRASEADGVLPDDGRWHPSIHMPRWASRITLEVVSVRAERLQAISEADAKAEGWRIQPERSRDPQVHADAARDWFMDLWDSINAARGHGWDTNPWVWAVEFKAVQP